MSDKQKKFKFFILIVLALFVVVLSGYFFAAQKSTPEYRSKIERIMFEKKNKAPKYILTLPEKGSPQPQKTEQIAQEPIKEEPPQKLETMSDFVKAAPLIMKLKAANGQYALSVLENNPDLTEKQGNLILPKISDKNKKPWIEYGKNVDVAPNFYKIAVVLKNIGIDQDAFPNINAAMPSEVSFSFSPYTIDAGKLIVDARKKGHETYVDLLLASRDILKADNGPLSVGLTTSTEENKQRLLKTLSVNAPIGGMVIADGMVDKTTSDLLTQYLKELKNRGLLMIDATTEKGVDEIKTPQLPRRKADIVVDDDFSWENMKNITAKAEKIAQEKGQVLIVATPKPIVVTALKNWFETFSPQLSYEQMKEQNITTIEHPFALVPVSNLVVE